jgi:hypothetical protein
MSDEFYFDPETEEGSQFELIPVGSYVAEIIDAELAQPRSGDGCMLKLTWKITEGDYEGRQLWQTLCYQHSNLQTQTIARRTLKDLCTAFDINEQVKDPDVFKHKPARIRVSVESDKSGQYDDQNRIRRVKALTDSDGEAQEAKRSAPTTKPTPTKSVPSQSNPAGNGPGAAPWKRT